MGRSVARDPEFCNVFCTNENFMKSSLHESSALLTERLARQDADLTASERALAEALGRDYPHALLESATALAARTGTSASTVAVSYTHLTLPTTPYV